MTADAPQLRYDATTIALHWIVAVLVGLQWVIGQTIDDMPKGAIKLDYIGLHLTIGVLIGAALLFRLAWRAGPGRRLPPANGGAFHVLAKATHWGFYILIGATVALGITFALAWGVPVYTVARIHGLAAGNRPLARALLSWHGTLADAVLILAGLHACAALFHHYILGDRLIRRMSPALVRTGR